MLRAYDGLEALDALHTHDVQLMILDVMMPRMDGLSATMQIRKEKNVPILLLSAKTEDADKIAGLAIGADDYITKPYNPMELVARVKAMRAAIWRWARWRARRPGKCGDAGRPFAGPGRKAANRGRRAPCV